MDYSSFFARWSEIRGLKEINIVVTVGARQIYERAVEFFGEEHMEEKLFLAFGKFEENCKEVSSMCAYI